MPVQGLPVVVAVSDLAVCSIARGISGTGGSQFATVQRYAEDRSVTFIGKEMRAGGRKGSVIGSEVGPVVEERRGATFGVGAVDKTVIVKRVDSDDVVGLDR